MSIAGSHHQFLQRAGRRERAQHRRQKAINAALVALAVVTMCLAYVALVR